VEIAVILPLPALPWLKTQLDADQCKFQYPRASLRAITRWEEVMPILSYSRIALLAAPVAFATWCFNPTIVRATTIDFNGLATNGCSFLGDCGPFTSYTESGFTVSAVSGNWLAASGFITFINPPTTTASVTVTAAGVPFSFSSIDLYSSITPIPYIFTGLLNGNTVFTASGTVPNTFGNFAKVSNPDGTDMIDTLQVTLSNPPACCSNPVGLDNIVVDSVPEPPTLSLLSMGIGLTGIAMLRRSRLPKRT
jgi:hypothetical protein